MFNRVLILFSLCNILLGQQFGTTDQIDLIEAEKESIKKNLIFPDWIFRQNSVHNYDFKNEWILKFNSELYYNSNAPNLENTSDKWIGRGINNFHSLNISYFGKYLSISVEPAYFISQNNKYDTPNRLDRFSKLNDNLAHTERPYRNLYFRETKLFLHKNDWGLGISNSNMWWGSGTHTSFLMSNNTTGFPYFSAGTMKNKKLGSLGYSINYYLSKLNGKNKYEPYFNGITASINYGFDPQITFGLAKIVIAGGTSPESDKVRWQSAPFMVFTGYLFAPKNLDFTNYTNDDNLISAYLNIFFPESKFKLFLEAGRNDIAWDIYNLILAPDHSLSYIIGFRKFGLFYQENIYFGMEYFQRLYGKYDSRLLIGPGNKEIFDYNSYDGRYWGPHSGTDSDDLYFFVGWNKSKYTFQISFNYERHGLQKPQPALNLDIDGNEGLFSNYPEVKTEIVLKFKYRIKNYNLNFLIEREKVRNLEFVGKNRNGMVFGFGVETLIYKL